MKVSDCLLNYYINVTSDQPGRYCPAELSWEECRENSQLRVMSMGEMSGGNILPRVFCWSWNDEKNFA